MCCFFMVLMFLGPRFAFLVVWLTRQGQFLINQAFDTYIIPLLGLIFLPWTTLMITFVCWRERPGRFRLGVGRSGCGGGHCLLQRQRLQAQDCPRLSDNRTVIQFFNKHKSTLNHMWFGVLLCWGVTDRKGQGSCRSI